jgi:type IV secretion system protein VirD4
MPCNVARALQREDNEVSADHSGVVAAIKASKRPAKEGKRNRQFYDDNRLGVETLLRTMGKETGRFGGVLAAIGNRFLQTPQTERGSFFSTASVQTDFLDSLPVRAISKSSDFRLSSLREGVPTSIFLCLPVGRMQSHSRWLRLVVQMACVVLERMGTYPRDRTPILYLMEEFATLGRMEIMEAASAYFPGFGIKLWAVLQSVSQLKRHYAEGWELFLGNAGLVQCFANGDQTTLNYLAQRLERLAAPFELRTAFARDSFGQLLLMEGRPPAAALRLSHEDVEMIRRKIAGWQET